MEKTKILAMAVAILCCASPSFAQDINPSWYIQPNVSGFDPDPDFGVSERDWGAGFKIGKPVSQMWDMQFGANYARARQNPARYDQTLLGVDALLMISRGRIRPFILVGVGAQRDKVQNPLRNVRGTSPYATAGLGFQLSLTQRLAMQVDLRTVRGRLRDEQLFGFSTNNNKYLTVGFNYALSPPPAPPPPPAAMEQPAPVVQEPVPVPVPPPPPPPARFEKVTLATTELFPFNSATLNMPQQRLDEIAAALAADPSITDVDITGHADRLGSEQYNLRLSERRANAVRDYLVSRGIDGARLKAYGRGEANPIVTCTEKNRAALIKCLEPNRRVEVEQITIERRVQ